MGQKRWREEEYSQLNVKIPRELHEALKRRAEREGLSINLIITSLIKRLLGRAPYSRKLKLIVDYYQDDDQEIEVVKGTGFQPPEPL